MKYGFTLLTTLLGALALPASAQSLNLDELDKAVAADRLCTAGFNPVFGWFGNNGALGVQEVPGLQPFTCNRITPGNLRLRLGGLDLPLAEAFSYSLSGSGTVTMPLLEPALCEDYYTSGGMATWTHSILDANGDPMLAARVGGVASMNYAVSSGLFTPVMVSSYGNTQWLRCHSGLEANLQFAGGGDDELFSDSFEDSVPQLRIQILDAAGQPADYLTHTPNGLAQYKVRVSNLGSLGVSDVRIREFVPTKSGLKPRVTRSACTPQAGVSGLTLGQACGGSTGERTLLAKVSSLAPGASVEFDISRKSDASSADVAQALVQYAVFGHPESGTESEYRDNSRNARIKVVDNAAPVISCPNLPNPVQLEESQSPQPVSYQCTITDPEGDAITNVVATSSNTALLDVSATLSGTDLTVTLTPKPGMHGSATVALTAVAPPANGAMSFGVQISEFNDPPTFALTNYTIVLARDGSDVPEDDIGRRYEGPVYPHVVPELADNCHSTTANNCTVRLHGFVSNVSPGPGEGNQTVAPLSSICTASSGSTASSMFTSQPTVSHIVSTGSTYDLQFSYRKQASVSAIEVTCTIRFSDSGGAVSADGVTERILFKYKP